jgi:hypothetical protein
MASRELRIADDLALPLDTVTSKMAVLAVSGAGKTYTGSVIAEEMISAGIRVVAIDPVGVWWGLRAGASAGRGLPIVLFGGDPEDTRRPPPDVPLHESHGERIADLVVDGSFSCVLDVSNLSSKAAERRFLTDFARRLYRRNRAPLHLFLDEADTYCPQKPMGEEAKLLGAIQEIVRRGRARGLGCTLITQRTASLSKDVLTQIETLIAMRTPAPQDRDAIDAWVEANATKDERAKVMKSLASLKTGEAWVWSPSFLNVLQQITVRRRKTFDSSATPKLGQKLTPPQHFAEVDIAALRATLAVPDAEPEVGRSRGTVSPDPKLLAERDELRRQLADERAARRAAEVRAEKAVRSLEEVRDLVGTSLTMLPNDGRLPPVPPEESPLNAATARRNTAPVSRAVRTPPDAIADGGLRRGAREMLRVLCAAGRPISRAELAVLSVMNESGTFTTYLGNLRGAGMVTDSEGRLVYATAKGREAIPDCGTLPTCAELVQSWGSKGLRAGARRMLEELVNAYPKGLTREELAERTQHALSGTFTTYLGNIVGSNLAERRAGKLYATEALFMGGGR